MITFTVIDLTEGSEQTVTIADDHPPNLCPIPGCGGELRLMVRSSYFQYRRIDDDGEVEEDYQDCDDAIGETLETWLECNLCILQPHHTIEQRVTGSIEFYGNQVPTTAEYVQFANPPTEAPA